MRELFKALSELETRLMERMTLEVCEADRPVFSDITLAVSVSPPMQQSAIASFNDTPYCSIEEKELIVRNLGDKDKRQMHFTLSDKGRECLEALKANEIEIPELLKPLFK